MRMKKDSESEAQWSVWFLLPGGVEKFANMDTTPTERKPA